MQIRKTLFGHSVDRNGVAVELLTRAPGYLLKVDEELIDVTRFGALVRRGRTLMAGSGPERAAAVFRQALDLRRGHTLADLVEAGISWPERDAVENACLDAFEDYAEVELMCGRHEEVLVELQRLTRAEGRREWLLGLCMMALARCGRQAEALDMYERRCAELELAFGIEPGPELQRLHHAIRTRDPVLLLPGAGSVWSPARCPAPAADHALACTARDPGTPRPLPGSGAAAPPPGRAHRPPTERRQVTVLQVRVLWQWTDLGTLPESVEEKQTQMHTAVQEEVARFGGILLTRMGANWQVAFGADPCHGDDPYRAVLCALALRARFTRGDRDAGTTGAFPAPDGGVLVAVASGLAVVRARPDGGPPAVTGTVGEMCSSLLPYVHRDEIWVCDRTRRATEAKIVYHRAQIQSVVWCAIGVQPYGHDLAAPQPTVGRDWERRRLDAELDRFLAGTGPRLVSLVGDPGTGKTHLAVELLRTLRQRHAHEPPPVVRLPAVLDDWSLAHALRDCCGITAQDPSDVARAKLGRTAAAVARTPDEAMRTRAALLPLLERTPDRDRTGDTDRPQTLMTLLESMAHARRLVLVVDDVEYADPLVLDFVDRISQPFGGASAFVIADTRRTAGTTWLYGTTVTVPPLADRDLQTLWDRLLRPTVLVPHPVDDDGTLDELLTALRCVLVPVCAGLPRVAHDYVRLIRDALRRGGEPTAYDKHAERLVHAVPPTLRWRSEAALDRLPGTLRVTLQDAATVDTVFWADAVAAAGGRDRQEVRADLADLVRRGLLSVSYGDAPCQDPHYVFRDPVDRHVAHARIPLQECAHKSANYALWISGQTPGQREEFLRHCARGTGAPLPGPGDDAGTPGLPLWYPDQLAPLAEGLRALLSLDRQARTAFPFQHGAPCPASP
ncbi:BTAD domain-containing putative transcriptional regulator [Streptomyces caeruleatus]|nr:BTAD domain-containing putative transcriptional regulator [Streptomyces caeruleatus]